METLLLGVLASVATEVVTWVDAKLSGTVLKGDGALILSAVVALVLAGIKVFSGTSFSYSNLGAEFAQVWATAQVFFVAVVQSLNLDVNSTSSSTPSSASTS